MLCGWWTWLPAPLKARGGSVIDRTGECEGRGVFLRHDNRHVIIDGPSTGFAVDDHQHIEVIAV